MNFLQVSCDVCVFCCGLTIGKKLNNRLRRKSGSHDQVLAPSSHATEDQLIKAGITRHCVDKLSICPTCQENWTSPEFDSGNLIYPKVC